jgi:hypothetical protein
MEKDGKKSEYHTLYLSNNITQERWIESFVYDFFWCNTIKVIRPFPKERWSLYLNNNEKNMDLLTLFNM